MVTACTAPTKTFFPAEGDGLGFLGQHEVGRAALAASPCPHTGGRLAAQRGAPKPLPSQHLAPQAVRAPGLYQMG